MSADSTVIAALVVTLLSPLAVLAIARRRLNAPAVSPTWLVVAPISGVGTLGFLLRESIGTHGGSAAIDLQSNEAYGTALAYAGTAWIVTVGSILAMQTNRARPAPAIRAPLTTNERTLLLMAATVPVLLLVISVANGLIQRDQYLTGDAGGLASFAQQLILGTAGVCGYVFAASPRGERWRAGVPLVLAFTTTFALGSRRLALLALVAALGATLARPQRWRPYLLIGVALSVALLPVPLYLRSSPSHGLFPYLGRLATFSYFNVDWTSTLNNVLISFPITGATIYQQATIPIEYFWVSINPLPGSIAGFYDLSMSLRINAFTPYSTIGEVWNYGGPYAIVFWLAVGAIVGNLELTVRRWTENNLALPALVLIALSALFAVTALEYNLRASARMLVYALIVVLIVKMARSASRAVIKSRGLPATGRRHP